MVLAAFALSVRAVFLALVVPLAYLMSTSAPSQGQVYAFWAAWYVYFGWAASQFYPGPRVLSWIRGAIAAAIAHATIIAAMLAGNAAYVTLAVR